MNVLVLVFSNLKHDARVKRQVEWLRRKHEVTVVCFEGHDIPGVQVITLRQTRLTRLRKVLLGMALVVRAYDAAYRLLHDYGYLEEELKGRFDLVVANDIDTLPLAFRLRNTARVVFDAHEYAPRHFENNRIWRIFFQPFYVHLCRRYIPKTSGMLTVGRGLAVEYEKHFGVAPLIITNATRYHEIAPSAVQEDRIRLVYHGIANPSRGLEQMAGMMDYLDERFTLDLILMISDFASARTRAYIQAFTRRVEANPRIRCLPPVPSEHVVETINQYDIGIFLVPPINFNYANTLPNKLFEYIQARLGVAIGPTREMAEIVRRFENGVVSEDFLPQSLARKLNTLTRDDVARFKEKSAVAARELNAEKNEVLFNDLIEKISR